MAFVTAAKFEKFRTDKDSLGGRLKTGDFFRHPCLSLNYIAVKSRHKRLERKVSQAVASYRKMKFGCVVYAAPPPEAFSFRDFARDIRLSKEERYALKIKKSIQHYKDHVIYLR